MKRRTGTQGLRQHGLFPAQNSGGDKENSNLTKDGKFHEGGVFIMSALK